MDWITTANGLIALITGLCGLIGTGIGAFFAIKNLIKAMKEKSAKEIWNTIVAMADAAMKQAEQSQASGADKKKMVMDAVKEGCKAAGKKNGKGRTPSFAGCGIYAAEALYA